MNPIGVVDLFAGPGGLGEGFCPLSSDRNWPYNMVVSIEKDSSAHQTLLLRSFLRKFRGDLPEEYFRYLNGEITEPEWSAKYTEQWAEAKDEAKCLTLGEPETNHFLDGKIQEVRERFGDRTVLLGGPPCQAYSLAGRVRNASIAGYLLHKDERTRLYEEYIHVLRLLEPAFFVLENVKGVLSTRSQGEQIFERILSDLRGASQTGYKLVPAALDGKRLSKERVYSASDFVVRSEEFGIPQARHRVIIVGIRSDIAEQLKANDWRGLEKAPETPSVGETLDGISRLRSGISQNDSIKAWRGSVEGALRLLSNQVPNLPVDMRADFKLHLKKVALDFGDEPPLERECRGCTVSRVSLTGLGSWLSDERLLRMPNHESRSHMPSDLARYLFASIFASVTKRSPKTTEFPKALWPAHRNWRSGRFADRFRVQLADAPATTVTSHISKDGHYYIHFDPSQCRSLTVREAARLQTFPDNYLFKGSRTQQYVQVGNAVPPYLANQIARAIAETFSQFDSIASTSSRADRGVSELANAMWA